MTPPKDTWSDESIQEQCLAYMRQVSVFLWEPLWESSTEKSTLHGKGTSLVYCAAQEPLDPIEAGRLNAQLSTLKQQIAAVAVENMNLDAEIGELRAMKTSRELQSEIQVLEDAIAQKRFALDSQEVGPSYTEADAARINQNYETFRMRHKQHKQEFEMIFNTMCEGFDKTREQAAAWRQELGIDEVEEDEFTRWVDDPLPQRIREIRLGYYQYRQSCQLAADIALGNHN